ncbi:MAG: carboxymuconolactone decarboxylase family protein [Deltaproteobacteria bacterium]|nr:carboxymuconolactone decarboxylase family protein [Deltaproteobacteria bacterium]
MNQDLEALRERLPDQAKDIKLNLGSLLQSTVLTPAQIWGSALAAAGAAREPRLFAALKAQAEANAGPAVVDDALAAASLMAMNNVFYRFRHMIGKPGYADKPARLRMNRIVKPSSNRTDFELFCLVVSAINGCESCVRSHEHVVVEGGLSEDQVLEAVRLGAVVQAAAVSLELAG